MSKPNTDAPELPQWAQNAAREIATKVDIFKIGQSVSGDKLEQAVVDAYAFVIAKHARASLAPAAQGEAAAVDTKTLNEKLEDAGFGEQEMRVIQILISQSIKPAPDKGEVASRIVNAIWNADRQEWRSIIEAELGGK